jgi:lipopolysaccharide export LptBFGC system permease protein LptF
VTLQLYILRQLLVGLVFSVGGMLVIAVPGMAIGAIQRLGGAFIGLILGYLPMEFVGLVPYFIPIGFLLAVVSTYSRMATDNEWTAMCMAGFSPLRLFVPGLVMAGLLGGVTWYMDTAVAPPVGKLKRDYRNSAIVRGIKSVAPGQTHVRIGDFVLSSRFREGNEFREAQINIPGADGQEDQQLLAERLSVEITDTELIVHTKGARWIHSNRDASLADFTIKRPINTLFGAAKVEEIKYKFLPNTRLRAELAAGRVPEAEVRGITYRMHDRDTKGALCLIFFLVGAPTGLLLRGGTQLGALASAVGFALIYYTLSLRIGLGLASMGAIPAWLAAWGTSVLGLSAGLLLTLKVMRR